MICDGRGTQLKVITTAANVNDVTHTLASVDGIPPIAGRPGRPRRRPEAPLGDKGYDANPTRNERSKRRILHLTPLPQRAGRRCLSEVVHQVPRSIDIQDEVARDAVRSSMIGASGNSLFGDRTSTYP